MNLENLNYLKDTLKYHGFGEKLFGELEVKMKAVEKEFTLSISTEMQKDKISGTLHFRKSNDSDMYFFNKYEAKLEKAGQNPREHTFYLDKSKGFTMKEAYNLLDGRAVHKEFTNQEGDKYKAWRQLDLDYKDKNNNFEVKQYSERYGYDLREQLSYYPIREFVKADDSLNLTKSLERGNLHTVTMDANGEKMQLQIAADPKARSLKVFDMEGRELSKTEREELMYKPEIREQKIEQRHDLQNGTASNAATTKQDAAPGQQASPEKTETPGKEQGSKEQSQAPDKVKVKNKDLLPKNEGNGLLQKKRNSSSKIKVSK